jgi:hypothetical protein
MIPNRFKHLITTNISVKHQLLQLLSVFPRIDTTEIKTLTKIESELQKLDAPDCQLTPYSVQLFIHVVCDNDVNSLTRFKTTFDVDGFPSTQLNEVFSGISKGIAANKAAAIRVMDRIFSILLRIELHDRFEVVKYKTDIPFYIPRGSEVLIVSLAHFRIDEFTNKLYPSFSRFVNRDVYQLLTQLVRVDVSLFCQALHGLPKRCASSRRFEIALWGEDGVPHEYACWWMFAYCSLYPIDVFRCMGWLVSPTDRARMTQMAESGWTIQIKEIEEFIT